MASSKRPVGRPSLFTDTARKTILAALNGGASMKDAAHMAGVSETTLHEWIAIGRAYTAGEVHPRMPKALKARAAFAEFVEQVEKARAAARFRNLSQVQAAGRERWIHHKTGTIRNEPPLPITWLHQPTGALLFEDPAKFGYPPEEWERQWSGEAWLLDRPQWQAAAWMLERSDPDNWGRRTRTDVTVTDWRTEAIDLIRQKLLTYEALTHELGTDLASELFRQAGVPVVSAPDAPEAATGA